MKPEKVTATMLEEKGTQCFQVDTFRKEWPDGAEVTLDNVNRAVELKLDIGWFAISFLAATAREAYDKAIAPAWEAYERAMDGAPDYFKIATAREAYLKARATALYEAWQKMK